MSAGCTGRKILFWIGFRDPLLWVYYSLDKENLASLFWSVSNLSVVTSHWKIYRVSLKPFIRMCEPRADRNRGSISDRPPCPSLANATVEEKWSRSLFLSFLLGWESAAINFQSVYPTPKRSPQPTLLDSSERMYQGLGNLWQILFGRTTDNTMIKAI